MRQSIFMHILFYVFYECLPAYICTTWVSWFPPRPKEDIWCPGTRVKGNCDPPDMCAGHTEPWSLQKPREFVRAEPSLQSFSRPFVYPKYILQTEFKSICTTSEEANSTFTCTWKLEKKFTETIKMGAGSSLFLLPICQQRLSLPSLPHPLFPVSRRSSQGTPQTSPQTAGPPVPL